MAAVHIRLSLNCCVHKQKARGWVQSTSMTLKTYNLLCSWALQNCHAYKSHKCVDYKSISGTVTLLYRYIIKLMIVILIVEYVGHDTQRGGHMHQFNLTWAALYTRTCHVTHNMLHACQRGTQGTNICILAHNAADICMVYVDIIMLFALYISKLTLIDMSCIN